jgi:YihY family inner membrane protein
VKRIERVRRRLDVVQQGHRVPAVAVAVVKKFGDDQAGNLTSVIAYTGFVTLFPLLLVFFTVLGLVLADNPSARHSITTSALADFPLVGQQLQANIHTLQRSSVVGLVIGLLVLVWGSLGLAKAGMHAMAEVWNVPGPERPRTGAQILRSLEFLAVLAGGVIVSTGLAAFGTNGDHSLLGVVAEALAVAVNIGQYLLAFRILTPPAVATRALVPGAVLGGVGWTVLLAVGGYVVGHQVRHAGAAYGTFGVVIGLVAWIYLGARLSLYAAELNTVLAGHLWPRTLVQPPFSEADQRVADLRLRTAIVRPEQRVDSTFDAPATTQAAYLAGDGQGDLPTSTLTGPPEEVATGNHDGGGR